MKKNQKGFSLLEIILSLSVGLVLFAGIMSVLIGMRTTTQVTNSLGELQENGRFALSVITEDLMRQNFWGDLASPLNLSNSIEMMYAYVSCRPDIGYPITLMSKYASCPSANH